MNPQERELLDSLGIGGKNILEWFLCEEVLV